MLVLKIITMLLGAAFSLFGYSIYFKGKYNLINGFAEDYRAGRKDECYAKKMGLIELAIGIMLLIVSVILIIAVR